MIEDIKIDGFAPVVLFVYNRLDHVSKTMDALIRNDLCSDTDIYIYSDGPRCPLDDETIHSVRIALKTYSHFFKSFTIIERELNIGLAANIIDGVTSVCNQYGRVIVLEDDIQTSRYFLRFMNDALELYKTYPSVISVSGCNYPVDLTGINAESYFLRIPLCWGWATWQDRWSDYKRDLGLVDSFSANKIRYINFDGCHDFFNQAKRNKTGKLKTWFIFWYMLSVKNNMLTLFPQHTLVKNIGHDGSGENCGSDDIYSVDVDEQPINVILIDDIKENAIALDAHKRFFLSQKISVIGRVSRKLRRMLQSL